MKKAILLSTILFFGLTIFAQSTKFENKMKLALTELNSATEKDQFAQLAEKFDEIAKKNRKEVQPLYYSAYCRIHQAFRTTDANAKDSLLKISKKHIDKAILLDPNNAELYILSALNYQAAIKVNPAERGQSYSSKASLMLKKANELQENNPRVLFLTGQNIFYRPTQFGGGAEKAKPYFEKAAKLFSNQKTSNFSPIWGEKTNTKMLKKCKN